ncbi:MAG: hypothetical protein K9J30_05550 [Bacteroidales bacterium]|nr:hypothetical protein [Bacteroidales bacterium]
MKNTVFSIFLCFFLASAGFAQNKRIPVLETMPLQIQFDHHLQEWDGFGFNYVETAQTTDYNEWPQDYGGFSLLSDKEKDEIINHVFGEDGLKVGLVKMFLDPWHQPDPGGPFDHEKTTSNMREFVKAGYEVTKNRGAGLQIITTLYGPPAWATKQKFLRGRDLDQEMKDGLARYMVDWARFLQQEEGLPLKYISLHNEGEDWHRWPRDGMSPFIGEGHDYNMWWPSEQTVNFIKMMPGFIKDAGLEDVHITNGECSNWFRFSHWGDAVAISGDPEAVRNLGLVTSHGFYNGTYNYWYGDHNPLGIDLIKAKRPEIHAWVTSSSWAKMDADFVRQIYGSIYSVGVNGFIPWAGIQRPPLWVGGDPNPGNAIQVSEEGDYELRNGYYFYKQVSRAGQPGMKVARTITRDTELTAIAFSSDGTGNPDAFVVLNTRTSGDSGGNFSNRSYKDLSIHVKGTKAKRFIAYRTDGRNELYKYIGEFPVENGVIEYTAPPGSVTSFFAAE